MAGHLYYEMPLNFTHTLRTNEEKLQRESQIKDLLDQDWSADNMKKLLGPVPAAIISLALDAKLKICSNFDGDHVDLDICKKTVELIGSQNIMLMTDRIQSKVLGGQELGQNSDNSLLYQSRGIVAGGSQSVVNQIGNMMEIGLGSRDILNVVRGTAEKLLLDV